MTIEEIKKCLNNLGNNSEDIADNLLKNNICGIRGDSHQCPLSKYMNSRDNENLSRQFSFNKGFIYFYENGKMIQISSSIALEDFILDFDYQLLPVKYKNLDAYADYPSFYKHKNVLTKNEHQKE